MPLDAPVTRNVATPPGFVARAEASGRDCGT